MDIELQDLLEDGDGYIEGVDAGGVSFGGPEWHGLRILDSRFVDADLDGAKLTGCGLVDVRFEGARASEVAMVKSSLLLAQQVLIAQTTLLLKVSKM